VQAQAVIDVVQKLRQIASDVLERERELAVEVARWLEAAEAADVEEDRQFGADKAATSCLPGWPTSSSG
jgi:hypothetical protein